MAGDYTMVETEVEKCGDVNDVDCGDKKVMTCYDE